MIKVRVDFSEITRTSYLRAYLDRVRGDVAVGDRVLAFDGGGKSVEAEIEVIETDRNLAILRLDTATWNG